MTPRDQDIIQCHVSVLETAGLVQLRLSVGPIEQAVLFSAAEALALSEELGDAVLDIERAEASA